MEVQVSTRDDVCLAKLSGALDSDVQWHGLVDTLFKDKLPLVIDLDDVHRITPAGTSAWKRSLAELPDCELYFVRCRSAFVNELNTVPRFGRGGAMVSLYAPYICVKCDREFETFIDLRTKQYFVDSPSIPLERCPDCGGRAEFDELTDSYFKYLRAQPRLVLPPAVERLIDRGSSTVTRQRLSVEKQVEQGVTALWLSGDLGESARFKRMLRNLEGRVVVDASHLTGSNPEGLRRLRPVLEHPDVYLARVPLRIVDSLSASEGGFGKAKLVSVMIPLHCEQCGEFVSVPFDAAGIANMESARRVCPVNLAHGALPAPADTAPFAALPLEEAPIEVRAYLAAHHLLPSLQIDDVNTRVSLTSPGDDAHLPTRSQKDAKANLGRFKLLRKLGQGGMAEVMLATQMGPEGFHKRIVIKRILPYFAKNEEFVRMFLEEARLSARINHSNVVQIFDLGQSGDDYYIVMEFVDGWDLNTILKLVRDTGGEVPVEIACRIVSDMCAGLYAAHSYTDDTGQRLPIIHRDISTHNVLISKDGLVKLTDFGIAKAGDSFSATKPGDLKGKVIYMAPELINGDRCDERIDVYAAGLVLYELLTLKHPFRRASSAQSMLAIVSESSPRVMKARPNVPFALAAIVGRALDKNPERRLRSAQELQLNLEAFLAEYGKPHTQMHFTLWLQQLVRAADAVAPAAVPEPGDPDRTALTTPERPSEVSAATDIVTGDGLELNSLLIEEIDTSE